MSLKIVATVILLLCVAANAYPVEHFKEGNTTVFAMQNLIYGGRFMVGLGKDGQLWALYQQNLLGLPWSNWTQLTSLCPNATDANRPCLFDADPAIGRNADGRLEIFARFEGNLDLWQMYMTDPQDPLSWTAPREPSCVDQDQKTGLWWCFCPRGGPKNTCSYPQKTYWNQQPIFPTSDVSILVSDVDQRLQLYFRGFAGYLWMVEQSEPGNSDLYSPPVAAAPGIVIE